MASLLKKREARHKDMIDTYYLKLNEAEKYRDKENSAAIIIQKDWRMFKIKWKFDDKKRATLKIQRIWRGYIGRCQFNVKKEDENQLKQSKFFNE